MKTIIIPGYGDRTDYLKPTLARWEKKFNCRPEVVIFGWDGEAGDYERRWSQFCEAIKPMGKIAIIGISAGASVGLRALQEFPNRVSKLITVCGPINSAHMSRQKLQSTYPLLERALDALDLPNAPADQVMTLRPLFDEVVSVDAMQLPGATDKRIAMIGHAPSIAWGMFHYARDMHDFFYTSA